MEREASGQFLYILHRLKSTLECFIDEYFILHCHVLECTPCTTFSIHLLLTLSIPSPFS